MYTIGHLIYGIPVTEDIMQVCMERDEELGEEDGGYFVDLYNGGGAPSGYLGVELTCFDECESVLLSDLLTDLTLEQSSKAIKAFEKLPIEYKRVAKPIALWIIWSTS